MLSTSAQQLKDFGSSMGLEEAIYSTLSGSNRNWNVKKRIKKRQKEKRALEEERKEKKN